MQENQTLTNRQPLPNPSRYRHDVPVMLIKSYEYGIVSRADFWRQLRLMWGDADVDALLKGSNT